MSTVPGLQATFIKMVDTGRVLGARRGDMDDVGERLGYFRLPDRTLWPSHTETVLCRAEGPAWPPNVGKPTRPTQTQALSAEKKASTLG